MSSSNIVTIFFCPPDVVSGDLAPILQDTGHMANTDDADDHGGGQVGPARHGVDWDGVGRNLQRVGQEMVPLRNKYLTKYSQSVNVKMQSYYITVKY